MKKLDHKENTIYIHIDAKSFLTKDDEKLFADSCNFSKVILTDCYSVNWGGYSQVNNQLRLSERAIKDNYDYYHFISGVDFPIKSMEYIHNFFEENKGKEFVGFSPEAFCKKSANRYKICHFLKEKRGRTRNIFFCNGIYAAGFTKSVKS